MFIDIYDYVYFMQTTPWWLSGWGQPVLLSPWNVVPSPIHAVAPLWLGDGFGSVGGLDGGSGFYSDENTYLDPPKRIAKHVKQYWNPG